MESDRVNAGHVRQMYETWRQYAQPDTSRRNSLSLRTEYTRSVPRHQQLSSQDFKRRGWTAFACRPAAGHRVVHVTLLTIRRASLEV
jgi:hypothetical protein